MSMFQGYGQPNQNSYDNQFQNPYYNNNNGFIRRTTTPSTAPSNIPVRVVFSPEQIAPQEIPTNGTPALFPLSDGSCIIAKSLLPNGMFDESIYVLQRRELPNNAQNVNPENEQLLARVSTLEEKLKKVLNDLYGAKNSQAQEGGTSNE